MTPIPKKLELYLAGLDPFTSTGRLHEPIHFCVARLYLSYGV